MKKVKFNITGMTCDSCRVHVEKAVNKLSGISKANVNLLSNNMIVEYDEKIINNEEIIKTVQNAGYKANIADENKEEAKNEMLNSPEDEVQSMKKRLIISVVFLIPLMYLAMHHMLNEWFGLPIPSIVKKLFHGDDNAIAFGFTQLLLLLPIVYVNRNYFIIGFNRLLKKAPNMDSLIAIRKYSSH